MPHHLLFRSFDAQIPSLAVLNFCLKMSLDPEMKETLKDFTRGPLCEYRKKASFNWKDMSVYIQGKESLKLKVDNSFAIY